GCVDPARPSKPTAIIVALPTKVPIVPCRTEKGIRRSPPFQPYVMRDDGCLESRLSVPIELVVSARDVRRHQAYCQTAQNPGGEAPRSNVARHNLSLRGVLEARLAGQPSPATHLIHPQPTHRQP